MEKPIKVGVYGAGRGAYLAKVARSVGMDLVAICDSDADIVAKAKENMGAENLTLYSDFDKFLEHELDAVIVANYATEHTPAAIKALKSGRHVMSECMAMATMAEAVQLAEAVEASGKVYFFAENVPFNAQCQEMHRLYANGEMGKFQYGEAEYIHPGTAASGAALMNSRNHWRSWIPITYYSTHSMGPIMMVTDTRPTQVNGFVVPYDFDDPIRTKTIKKADVAGILMCKMSNGAIAKVMPCAGLRDVGYRIRFCCNKGTMEYNQGDSRLRIHREQFDFAEPVEAMKFYTPEFPEEFKEAGNTGHGGADYFCAYYFAKAINEGSEPLIDVYKGIDMSSVGILGYRSALQGGMPLEVPDFRDKAVREKYRNDDWNPNPALRRPGMPYSSILGDIPVPEENYEFYEECRKNKQ